MNDEVTLKDNWDKQAREKVRQGPDALSDFLDAEQLISSDKYVMILKYACEQDPDDENGLPSTIFDCLERNQFYTRTQPGRVGDRYSMKEVRNERKSWHEEDPHLSYFDLFTSSIRQWTTSHRNYTVPIWGSPVIKMIWDRGKDDLWSGGAIYACASYNLNVLLQHLLGIELPARLPGGEVERMQIAFLSDPDSMYTPLGIAIRRQYVDCVRTLLSTPGASKYIQEGHTILVEDSSEDTILHTTLNWARSQIALTSRDHAARVKKLIEVLDLIILYNQEFLYKHDKNGRPPYQYALELKGCGPEVEHYLREKCFDLKDPDDVRMGLYRKDDPGKELGLELSDFNHDFTHFADFVNELVEMTGQGVLANEWQFENILLYMNLPNLRGDIEYSIVATLLEWLSARGVKRIKTFRLPDHGGIYSADWITDHVLKQFQVDRFDWVQLDADVAELARYCLQKQIPAPKGLTLYYNQKLGIRNMNIDELISDWLNQVDTLSVVPVVYRKDRTPAGTFSFTAIEKSPWAQYDGFDRKDEITQSEFQPSPRMLYRFVSNERLVWIRLKSNETVDACSFFPEDELKDCHDFLSDLEKWLPTLQPANAHTRHCLQVMREGRVKIALIDNGVDRTNDRVRYIVEYGASFVRAGGRTEIPQLPWFTPADPHGTQMAGLIQQSNPWCRLFPIRVGSLQRDVDAQAATKAIEWAIEQRVDIISMSWVITKKNEALEAAVAKAAAHNILLFCSTADTGTHSNPLTFPVNYPNVISVSAADKMGKARHGSCHDVHVMLPGEEVSAEGPRFIRNYSDKPTGSSVATALAAGIASLCLFLARMANFGSGGENFKDRLNMLTIFRSMQANDTDRFLLLHRIFSGDTFGDEGFKCKPGFRNSNQGPPPALARFVWNSLAMRSGHTQLNPSGGSIPRRGLSRDRGAIKAQ